MTLASTISAVWSFIAAHRTEDLVGMGWLFSCACSTMPPLRENAGYLETWLHNFLQVVAANPHLVRMPSAPIPPSPKENL